MQNIKKILYAFAAVFAIGIVFQLISLKNAYHIDSAKLIEKGKRVTIKVETNEVSQTNFDAKVVDKLFADANKPKGEEQGPPIPKDKSEVIAPVVEQKSYDDANLAVIVTDVGLREDQAEILKVLPTEVAFAFVPYSENLQKKIDAAKGQGREALLNLMFEPSQYPMKDNGPLTIQTHYDAGQNAERFNSTIVKIKNYDGFLAVSGEIVTSKAEVASIIMKKTSEQGKYFGYFRQTGNTQIEDVAKPLAADLLIIDHFVDEVEGEKAMEASLKLVKNQIINNGQKVVIAIHPYPTSVAHLTKWLKENEKENINIGPVKYFITKNSTN